MKEPDKKTKLYLLLIYGRIVAEITMIIGFFVILYILVKRII